MIGYAFCGSFCTHAKSVRELEGLVRAGLDVLPIMSETVWSTDTRFGRAEDLCRQVEALTGHDILHTVVDTEPLGPTVRLDALIISPCTGNTLAKIANGITDTAVCMAAKAHLRSDRPLILALASNDALSANLRNIGILLSRKHIYFVPMVQDDPEKKPHSLVADFTCLSRTLDAALRGQQERRLFL